MRRAEMDPGSGAMDERVAVTQITQSIGTGGTITETETTVATVWAMVEQVRGQERVISDRERGVQTYRITAHNNGTWATLDTTYKLVWRGLTLDIKTQPQMGRGLYRTIEAEAGIIT